MYNLSIVIYKTDTSQLFHLLHSIVDAEHLNRILIIDNSPTPQINNDEIRHSKIRYIHLKGANIGYGRAHNLAIRDSIENGIPFHLVMNPDVIVDKAALEYIHTFLQNHPSVGQVMPQVIDFEGERQFLCKLLPTPLNLFARRFLPKVIAAHLNKKYELRHLNYNNVIDAPYLSGCFMFFRTQALVKAGLFDERYFLYAEDIDITRSIHQNYRTIYLPDVTIRHQHARASYHSFKMLLLHIMSVCRYFNKWGWFFDKERHEVNKKTYEQKV